MIKLRKIILPIATLLLLSISSSCSSTKGWVYKSNDYDITANNKSKFSRKTIAILPFKDKRSGKNSNNAALYIIPLMPFGYQNYSTPDTQQVHTNSAAWLNFNPKESFADALVDELNATLIFKEAFSSRDYRDYDYFIKGEIVSSDYHGKILSYGFSAYGPLLWWFGLPASYVENHLEVKINLYRSKDKKLMFSKSYMANPYKKLGWIYNLPSDFEYNKLLSQTYLDFVDDFAEKFKLDVRVD